MTYCSGLKHGMAAIIDRESQSEGKIWRKCVDRTVDLICPAAIVPQVLNGLHGEDRSL